MRADRSRRPAILGEVLVVLVLVFVYDRIREFAETRADQALENGRRLLSAESWLRLDIEPAMNDLLSRHHVWEAALSWYYQLMHLTATLVVLVWVYWRHPVAYRPARNALVGMNAVGLVIFWVLPVAPPRLIPGAGFVDSAVVTGVAEKASTLSPDLYAAMPSLHVAWAIWVATQVLLIGSHRWGRRLAVAHAVLTCLIVMATANHYLLDVVAGAALAVAVVQLSRRQLGPDAGCPHVPAARDEVRQADREMVGVGLAHHGANRPPRGDRCVCGMPGAPAARQARAARPRAAGAVRTRSRRGGSGRV